MLPAVFCLNRWVLCIHTVEERRVLAALQMEAKFRTLAIEQQFHGFVRTCSVCFGSLNKCWTKRFTASIITKSCHSSLFISILPTNSKTFLQPGLVRRTSSRPVSVADFFGVLGVVEDFDLRWSLCRFGRAVPKHTRHMIQRLVHAATRRRIHRMIPNHRNAPTFGIFRRTASPKVACTSRRPSLLAKSLYGNFGSADDVSFKVCAEMSRIFFSGSHVST